MSWKAAVLTTAIWAFAIVHHVDAARGFLLTVPRSITKKATNNLELNLYEVDAPGTVTVQLIKNENNTVFAKKEIKIEAGVEKNIIEIEVPYTTEYEAKVQINGSFDTKDGYNIFGEDVVYFREPVSKICFIQTDKPLYKPGQKVQFRVLPVDGKLKPLGKDVEGHVYVEDPSSSRVAQWLNVTLGNGIRQLEFLLSDEPNLGTWKISVAFGEDIHTSTFEVKEYVLPKFEVVITPPTFVLVDAEIIPIEVCAKYTYGKLVEGTLKLNTSLETYSWSNDKFPVLEYEGEIEGCYNYTLNVSLVDREYQYSYRRLQIFAQVVEKGTGVIRNETKYVDRTQTPMELRFLTDRLEYFKPGLPYHGKVKVTLPDQSVAVDEPVQICVTVSRERILSEWWATRKVRYCRNFTSDNEGIINYTVQPQSTDAVSMNLEAKSTRYGITHSIAGKPNLYQPQTNKYLRPWYSPSGSHLQVQAIGETLQCDISSKIKLLFTANSSADYRFYYEVIGRGQVLSKNFADVSFSTNDDISDQACDNVTLDAQEIQLVPPPEKDADNDEQPSSPSESDNHCKSIKDARYVPYIGSADIEIDIDATLSPSFRVLVYYIRDDRETVADSQEFKVEKCFKNKVNFEFGDESKQPGTKTTVTLTASPNSLCGIKVLDKSVSLLDSSDELTKEKVFQELQRIDSGLNYPRHHCNDKKLQPGIQLKSSSSNYIMPPRPPRPWSSSSYEDAMTAFENAGFLVISDFFLLTRPCKTNTYEAYGGVALASVGVRIGSGSSNKAKGPPPPAAARPQAVAFSDSIQPSTATQSVVDVRNFFPETWLFQIEAVGENGMLTRKEELPHTITEWVGSAVCINKEDGLGLSNTASIKGFQAFFLSYTLPYSIIRGETLPLIVTVFNYLEECLPISLELEQSGGFLLLSDSSTTEICVCGGKSESHKFLVKPTVLETLNFTVRGKSADSADVCAGFETSKAFAQDAIVNPLLVEAEGFPAEKVENILFCPKDSEDGIIKRSITFVLPEDVVEDSGRVYLSVSGDIMGPAIQGLDRLVRLPTGCGEQNMVLFAPNIYVLDYLIATNKLTEEISTKAKQYLNSGYQRELKYRHPDGSYSAFGISDREGSMFLSAFVLRCFAQSTKYIDIDAKNLKQTQEWIVSKQGEDGCFPEVGRTLSHGIKGGVDSRNSSASMTAYVLTSLLVAGLENKTLVDSAITCLETENDLTPYKAALFAYAATLAKSPSADRFLDRLFEKALTSGDQTHWKNTQGSQSLDVETAAYAVLTLLKSSGDVKRSLPIVRWLTKNRNTNGGFISTQDTVIGLESLSQFASLLSQDPVNLEVSVTGNLEKKVAVSEEDKLLVKKFKVPEVPGQLHIEATGTGCGLIQASFLYNTKEPPKKETFSIEIEAKRSADEDCKYTTIKACVHYIPEGRKSNMAIVEVRMVSGMAPVKESLQQLMADTSLELKRYDVENNNAVFYFDELSNDKKCFELIVEEVIKIEDRKPATTKVYDYYAKEQNAEANYSIPDCK